MINKVSVELDYEEQELFKRFRQYQDVFMALDRAIKSNIFKESGGKCIFNIAKGGVLINGTFNDVGFWKKKKVKT